METFKFTLFSIVVLSLLGLGGYWAVSTIQSGSEHVSSDKIKKLENANLELNQEVGNLKDQLGQIEQSLKDEIQASQPVQVAQPPAETPVTVSAFKNQPLINELQKLVSDNVIVKLKSKGTRVGTLQKFLNLYNNTSNKIDNDFGADIQNALIVFQKASGLPGDGQAGKTTYLKMIDWLKRQG
jgi:small nuclear ribonucleoprotein (snRNP)-like protein